MGKATFIVISRHIPLNWWRLDLEGVLILNKLSTSCPFWPSFQWLSFLKKAQESTWVIPPPFSRVHALFCCLQKLWKHNLRVKPSSHHCSIGDEQHVGHQTPEWRLALSTISDATATVKLLCYLCVLEAIYVFEFRKIILHKISFLFKVLKSLSVFVFPLFLRLVMPFSVSQQTVITFFHSQTF
jgi:hypothetical protein